MRSWLFVFLICTVLAPVDTRGQTRPDRPVYYREWVESQLAAWDRIATVELLERTRRTLDNPFGVSGAQIVSRVKGYPDEREYEREVISAETNGQRVPARRLRQFEERWERFGRQLGRESNAFSGWRLRALLATRPSAPPVRDEYGGRRAYRVDLLPLAALENVDRITLWFAESDGRILASRTVFEPRPQRTSLIVEIEYIRIDDIDVPIRRVIEGTVQARRRLRHYTTIVTLESRFDDYRFEKK